MKSVRVYYAGIPVKNTKPEKRDMLTFFHEGVPDNQSTLVEGMNYQPTDLAVMQGWVHQNSGRTPHLMFRRKIINEQRKHGKHTLAIDSNLFLYRDTNNPLKYFRFSLDDVFPTTGNYFTDNVDQRRWEQIKRDYDMDLQPWRTAGNHILICLQRNGGWSMGDTNVIQWCNHTIKRLRKYTDRPILVRAHPGDRSAITYMNKLMAGVLVSQNKSITTDLINCWATVTFNSSPGTVSAIEGVPVFVTDPTPETSQACEVANYDLKNIENPKMPDRRIWIEKLAMCHFNYSDLRSGKAWSIIKDYL
jgi:hypothetical protein